jgi:hypothetical protein
MDVDTGTAELVRDRASSRETDDDRTKARGENPAREREEIGLRPRAVKLVDQIENVDRLFHGFGQDRPILPLVKRDTLKLDRCT